MNPEQTLQEEARKRLIFALDVPDRIEAKKYVQQLAGSVGCFKVGLELFVKEGPEVLKVVREHSDADIFLDLKLHDIPATLSRALISAATHAKTYNVKYVTIHLEEGESLPKVPQEVIDAGLEVLAVTVLTSISEEDLERFSYDHFKTKRKDHFKENESVESDYSKLEEIVIERAIQAKVSDCAGVICSGNEVKLIKYIFGPDIKTVVPGIRPDWNKIQKDDQSRTTTPAQAIERGADLIVVGRPIRDADDPKEAADKIVQEIAEALPKKQ